MRVWPLDVGAARAHECAGAIELKGVGVWEGAWMEEQIRKKQKWDTRKKERE